LAWDLVAGSARVRKAEGRWCRVRCNIAGHPIDGVEVRDEMNDGVRLPKLSGLGSVWRRRDGRVRRGGSSQRLPSSYMKRYISMRTEMKRAAGETNPRL
jgi:hypothetical protein